MPRALIDNKLMWPDAPRRISLRINKQPRTIRRTRQSNLLEVLEPRHMMAAAPVAYNDRAFFTTSGTDLVVNVASSPAPLLANDLDIDGGMLC